MCSKFTFHHQFGIDNGKSKFEQTTYSVLSDCGASCTRITRILRRSTSMHSVMYNTCIKHGRNMRMGRHQLCSEERIEVLSNTIERHHPSRNTPSLLYPDSCSDGNWRSHIRKKKVYASPRFLAKISFKDYWMKELGSEVLRLVKSSQSIQPNANTNHDSTERLVVCSQRKSQARFSRDSTNFNLEEETNPDRTARPVVCSQSESSMLHEVDIDFRISGLPHSVVKQAENYRVRELVNKIENHPHW